MTFRSAILGVPLVFFAGFASAGTINIDVLDLDNPSVSISGCCAWRGSGVTETANNVFQIHAGVAGAHRSFPSGPSRLLFRNSDDDILFGLRLKSVSYNDYYSFSTYYFNLWTVDELGVYSGPDWSSSGSSFGEITVNGNWQLAYSRIRTDLSTARYDVRVRGQDMELNPVPLPAAAWLFGPALLGLAGIGYRRNRPA
jgi:hypothetical protein